MCCKHPTCSRETLISDDKTEVVSKPGPPNKSLSSIRLSEFYLQGPARPSSQVTHKLLQRDQKYSTKEHLLKVCL